MDATKLNKKEILTAYNQISGKPSQYESHICECGGVIEPMPGPLGREYYPQICRSCRAIATANQNREAIRVNRKSKVAQLYKQLNHIPPLYRNARLGHIAKPLRDTLLNLPGHKGVYLWGPVGCGKTYTLSALGRHYVISGRSINRTKWDNLCLQIRNCYTNRNSSELAILKPFIQSDILIIEDLGTSVGIGGQETEFSVRMFLILLDERMENMRPTFISGNKPPEEIEKSFDQRVGSRLSAACEIIKVSGFDKRRRGK